MRPSIALHAVSWSIFGVVLLIASLPSIWNVDIFWHVATGDWILENLDLPSTDIFSAVAPDRAWYPFQWGYEVAVSLVESASGLQGLRLLTLAVLLISFGVLIRFSMQQGKDKWFPLAAACLLLVLFGDRFRVRPHVFNLLFTLLFLHVLVPGKQPARLHLSQLPMLVLGTAVWANIHAGGTLIFLVMLAAFPAGHFLEWLIDRDTVARTGHLRRLKSAFSCWIALVVTASLMPHFLRGAIHSIFMLSASEGLISEWKPAWSWVELFLSSGIPAWAVVGWSPFLFLALSLYQGFRTFQTRRSGDLSLWILAVGTSLISIRYGRFAWLCIVPALLLCLHGQWPHPSKSLHRRVFSAAGGILLLIATHYQVGVVRNMEIPGIETLSKELDVRRFPTQAVQFMRAANLEGNAWTLPNWGGYVLWALDRKVKVLSDGRGNYDGETAARLKHVYENRWKPESRIQTLEAYNAYPELDFIVIQSPAYPESEPPPGWVQVFPAPKAVRERFSLPDSFGATGEMVFIKEQDTKRLGRALRTWERIGERLRRTGSAPI